MGHKPFGLYKGRAWTKVTFSLDLWMVNMRILGGEVLTPPGHSSSATGDLENRSTENPPRPTKFNSPGVGPGSPLTVFQVRWMEAYVRLVSSSNGSRLLCSWSFLFH